MVAVPLLELGVGKTNFSREQTGQIQPAPPFNSSEVKGMRREIPLWLALIIVIVVILIAIGIFFVQSRVAGPGGGPPTPTPSEAQTGY